MKLLIATPCLSGFTRNYVSSLVGLIEGLTLARIDFQTLFLAQESMIQRARNDYVHYALEQNFTHILFIDSDMGWEWEDFLLLAEAKKRIISAMCVKKKYPIEFVLTPNEYEKPDSEGILRVHHAPVGFMLIDTGVFRIHADKVVRYSGVSSITGKGSDMMGNWFPAGIHRGSFTSEDIAFTTLMRECGESIYVHTKAKTTHAGIHIYREEQK